MHSSALGGLELLAYIRLEENLTRATSPGIAINGCAPHVVPTYASEHGLSACQTPALLVFLLFSHIDSHSSTRNIKSVVTAVEEYKPGEKNANKPKVVYAIISYDS